MALRERAMVRWKAVATAFLLGSHARLGAASVLKQMPSVLLLRILRHAKPAFCTVVEVTEGNPAWWNKTTAACLESEEEEGTSSAEGESDNIDASSSDDDDAGPPAPPGYAGIHFGEDLAHIMAECL